eukprot:TRINITY_DN71367_c0_g1_i1.p1 TRINITY_DN71367_c0_g1~~TRINITY_DN71367_c0_g1_i1.p1  ORF type:complete len:498 (+),score=112.77 TRINITY_DN71367_c0_g1_i1:76-1494(+)
MSAPMPPGCEVRFGLPGKGAGLFATEPCGAGAKVFNDQPLFVVQHTGNRRMVAACARCCAFVGPLGTQLGTLFGEARFQPLQEALTSAGAADGWQAQVPGLPAASAVRCAHGCGELYCSEQCRDAAYGHSHNLLCTGPITTEDHPLLKFKYHALEHADTLLLAAQAMAFIINRAQASGGGHAATRTMMNELLAFCHGPFRDVCRAPPGRAKDAEFYAHTDGLVQEAALLLKAALESRAPVEAAPLFEAGPAFLAELLGLFELNNIDVEVPSPLAAPLAARGSILASAAAAGDARAAAELQLLERMLREKEWLMRCVWGEETTGIYGDDDAGADAAMGGGDDLDAMLERPEAEVTNAAMAEARRQVDAMTLEQLLQAPWPALHGTALIPTVARINHSCEPNLKIEFHGNNSAMSAVSLRPIQAGEEFSISYILEEADLQIRRRRLLEYGFNCVCERCQREDSGTQRRAQRRLK